MPKIIKPTKANILAVPFGAKIAKTIEMGIKIKKGPAIHRPKNKIEVKNIEMKPKYSLIALSFLEKMNYTD
ncbi:MULTISPECIES: hypothetical protein [Bacillus]|uniref:Uncharacterized protein n=1 Tax=Bacillus pseudomycoides TaxID=64104 RepID=A0A1Y3MBC7_9BACI|nr:hypothetical protein [Bacillus cereus group sp. BfR-BA-01315]OUM46181.1 hypothetical protein BW425_25200 [Bacillus pseudomycoides]PEK69645.1 hypothetical protein CN590_09825 [Bacillus pseudomycoides]PEL26923.1 hypothetical protein CN608_13115 [Bacillus pseudomycoides]PGE85454.1 hypothetical protein COM55_12225 [Bacillus pseudomycoides]